MLVLKSHKVLFALQEGELFCESFSGSGDLLFSISCVELQMAVMPFRCIPSQLPSFKYIEFHVVQKQSVKPSFFFQSCSLPPATLFTPPSTSTPNRSPSANEIPESLGELCWLASCCGDAEVETEPMLLLNPPLVPPLLALMLALKFP